MGEHAAARADELAALQAGIDSGMTLIDTAEMYGNGASEALIAKAIAGRRREVFVVSKVFPHNATRRGVIEACERSLQRLGIDSIDLYLLHWRGSTPLAETLEAFQSLQRDGRIRYYGVSNFDLSDMQELLQVPGGRHIATNQVLYNLQYRGIEWDLLPFCRERGIPVMAYSPLEHADDAASTLLSDPVLERVAARHKATPAQIALAWLLHQPGVIVIPKAARVKHIHENRAAADICLTDQDLDELDQAFPPPAGKEPLAIR